MESGLEDRNNPEAPPPLRVSTGVSMESGLEDRNNQASAIAAEARAAESQWSPA